MMPTTAKGAENSLLRSGVAKGEHLGAIASSHFQKFDLCCSLNVIKTSGYTFLALPQLNTLVFYTQYFCLSGPTIADYITNLSFLSLYEYERFLQKHPPSSEKTV